MSRAGAFLLITAGSFCGVYGYLSPSSETSNELAEITRISAAPDRENGLGRTFAPASPAFSEVIRDEPDEPTAASPPKPGTWTTVVTSSRAVLSPLKASRPADALTREQLAHDLQQGLQRASCYQGPITGTWTAATRRAMAAFMDRANAVLPFKNPDYVLLALVQNHREITCAAECPSGQVMESDGRCLPHAILAQAEKRSQRLEQQRLADMRIAQDRDRVAQSEPYQREVLPWQRNQVIAVPLDNVAIAQRPAPPPGMMSIGGPTDVAPVASSESSSVTSPEAATSGAGAGAGVAGSDGGASAETAAKFAALQADPDADNLSDGSGTAAEALPLPADVVTPSHNSRRSDAERKRRHNSYASAGRRRHGDPRPGTARYNLMQSLGGIY
ncbi:MAG: hypothetical protein JSR99_09800 [Proteobacteria bacterium]|nr:hypothetical protein [Pseudomonadota bacterium]